MNAGRLWLENSHSSNHSPCFFEVVLVVLQFSALVVFIFICVALVRTTEGLVYLGTCEATAGGYLARDIPTLLDPLQAEEKQEPRHPPSSRDPLPTPSRTSLGRGKRQGVLAREGVLVGGIQENRTNLLGASERPTFFSCSVENETTSSRVTCAMVQRRGREG